MIALALFVGELRAARIRWGLTQAEVIEVTSPEIGA